MSDQDELPIKFAGMIWGNKKYTCVSCGEEIKGFRDKLSVKEYRISGLCQKCQDEIFNSFLDV